jgi:hypothetical protein
MPVYTEKKTAVGVFLGGPLAGGYYFWRNFKTLGRSKPAVIALVVAGIVLLVTLTCALVPGLDRLPNSLFWVLQMAIMYGCYISFLREPVAEYLRQGKPAFGWGNTIAVSLLSAALTIGIFLGVGYLGGIFNGPSVKTYGKLANEIAYDESNIKADEVDYIASALTSTGFFDDEIHTTVDASKEGNRYIITIYCSEGCRKADVQQQFKDLRTGVQSFFPTNPVVFDLVIGTPENRITRIE